MKRCDHCDGEIETREWYPTLARERDSGVVLFSFCSVACRNDWLSVEDD